MEEIEKEESVESVKELVKKTNRKAAESFANVDKTTKERREDYELVTRVINGVEYQVKKLKYYPPAD